MRTFVWIGVGWLGMTLITAFGARIGPLHVLPDMTILVVVFLAMRRDPMVLAFTALVMGYMMGRWALAPVGLHETSLVVVAIGVYLLAGPLSASGGTFFAFTCGLAVMAHQAVLFALIYWQQGHAGFASWASAALVPTGLCTCVLARLCHPSMLALERRLTQDKREGLTWR